MDTFSFDNDYKPSDDEDFMNPRQQAYFKAKLEAWRDSILENSTEALTHLSQDRTTDIDLNDRASSETDRALELRTHDRARKLLSKIEQALRKIEDGSYGYCEVTGEPISLKRLEARPVATLSIEAQEQHERKEKVYRDDLPVD
ncbi:traR/DksA family transcriptional regulator [Commensalibacter intestini A911]|uniref:RNA polymerase-binding transcription factor DksA n=2 Tax=Commensalibacter intestini TaxID=479936 RepID=A0A251ZTI3_9PROT|nr:RNA polymerase-binding protein DksA [Commensalibacter intestini]EHD15068.1 traR/DksA family transcriptional regulator [Commensalibacter intestini A911]OUI77983.1 molecular chaperone DnaK [Commensalibacter intestini]